MAIDPATAKLLASAAAKVVTDEDARKKVIITIVSIVVGILLLIAMVIQILTSPLSFIASMFGGNQTAYNKALEVRSDYGYIQVLSTTDSDYIAGSGVSYEGIVLTSGSTNVVYYNQLDQRYADKPYGTDKIGTHGCGPTSMAIVVSSLTTQTVDPVQMADWSYKNGGWCPDSGSYHSMIPNAAKAFGLKVEGDVLNKPQKIIDALSSGKLIVALMGKGNFTSSGHYIVLRGVTAEGKILVADPASRKRSDMEWDLNLILSQAKKGADAGGPLWIISK